jgi:hypothetical protein
VSRPLLRPDDEKVGFDHEQLGLIIKKYGIYGDLLDTEQEMQEMRIRPIHPRNITYTFQQLRISWRVTSQDLKFDNAPKLGHTRVIQMFDKYIQILWEFIRPPNLEILDRVPFTE